MRIRLYCATCLLILVAAGEAEAETDGFFVFGAWGGTDADISEPAQSRVHDDGHSFKVGAGYSFNQHFSVEAAYQDFDSQSAITGCPPDLLCIELVFPFMTEADLSVWSLSASASIPLNEKLDLFGKVGVSSWDVNFDGLSAAFDSSDEDLLYGAGLRLAVGEHWKVALEYEKIEADIDTVGFGASFHF